MKPRTKPLVVSFIFILVTIFFGTEKQKIAWKGKIEYKNGVKLVRNPGEPLHGEIEFELEKDLIIGREDDEKYLFFKRPILGLDEQENIFVLDSANRRIQKFDRSGRFIQSIGRKGQGPGEFVLPFKFFIGSNNHLYVYDNRNLKIFDEKGEFLRSIKLKAFILDFFVNLEENVFALSEIRDEKGGKQAVIRIEPGGEIAKRIVEFPYVEPIVIRSSDATFAFGAARHVYIPALYFSVINEKTFCYAHSSEYKVFIMENQNILLAFQKKESPQNISQQEKNLILSRMKDGYERRGKSLPDEVWKEVQFPASRPFFDGIMADDKQRLYVRRLSSVLYKSDKFEFDIFSKEGLYIHRTKLPFTPEIIKNGFIYHVDINEETGAIKIERFKIRNWNQISE